MSARIGAGNCARFEHLFDSEKGTMCDKGDIRMFQVIFSDRGSSLEQLVLNARERSNGLADYAEVFFIKPRPRANTIAFTDCHTSSHEMEREDSNARSSRGAEVTGFGARHCTINRPCP